MLLSTLPLRDLLLPLVVNCVRCMMPTVRIVGDYVKGDWLPSEVGESRARLSDDPREGNAGTGGDEAVDQPEGA